MLVAIDPGYAKRGRGCACARFDEHKLAAYANVPWTCYLPWQGDYVTRVVWEIPQVDARTRTSTPEVVMLAAVGATLAGRFAGRVVVPEMVSPREWKGSIPKPIAHRRIWDVLDDDERRVIGGVCTLNRIDAARRAGALDRWKLPGHRYYPGNYYMHNVLDAVGIGLWALGRRKP